MSKVYCLRERERERESERESYALDDLNLSLEACGATLH
jgi:hypothetical protein